MLLKIKKKDHDPIRIDELIDRLKDSDKKKVFYQLSIQTLLQLISDFSLDIEEIGSDHFKTDIRKLSDKFSTENKLKKIQARFEKDKKSITAFNERQKKYLNDREGELKDIIEILSNAMVTLDTENQQYNQKVLEQSEKIEQITLLDDIKKVKQALLQEIEHMRETVKEKQSRDNIKLESLSRQVNTLNVQLEKVRTESVTDGLTGIYNRKAFDRQIGELVDKNMISRSPFSLLLLDIDDFKTINDTYGHQTGDRVILAVINKCRQSIRSQDFLARYGGEEFAVIMSGASLKNAVKKANLICQSIAATRYALQDVSGSPTLSVTISIGVSCLKKSDSVAAVTRRADKALYAAKHAGKNCVLSEKEVS